MLDISSNNIYQAGGSLPVNATSYVTRQADTDLYEGLKAGQFCYVLNSRQMGKSSLRVRVMQRLREEGYVCAFIDLTGIGKEEMTPEKWYAGIVSALVSSCDLSQKVNWRSWWREHRDLLSPVQRLGLFIDEVLLTEISQNIVVFVDEIDRVLSQTFSPDDFFALIRYFYNQRADQPNYQRLSFTLLGVATPSDLITDKTQTPFNVGQAIALQGFELHEVQPLVSGLQGKVSDPRGTIATILNWTGGQPFMTQRLCQLVASSETYLSDSNLVDQLVYSRVIENWEAQDEPEHLKTIRDRLLRDQQKAGRLLSLYQRILQQGAIVVDGSSEQTELRLSGLVVQRQGTLRVYNRIYQQVFNLDWLEQQFAKLRPYSESLNAWVISRCQDEARLLRGRALQDALDWAKHQHLSDLDYRFLAASQDLEKQAVQQALAVKEAESQILAEANQTLNLAKQQAQDELTQAKRTARRITGIGSIILLTSLAIAAIVSQQAQQATRELAEANVLLPTVASEIALRTSPFDALLEALKAGHQLQALQRNHPTKPETHRQVISTLQAAIYNIREYNRCIGHRDKVTSVRFNPGGNLIASASADRTIKVWDLDGNLLNTLRGHDSVVRSVHFSPNGKLLASTGDDGTIKLWEVETGTEIKALQGRKPMFSSVRFSPDSKLLAVAGFNGTVRLFNVEQGKLLRIISAHQDIAAEISFSPDGKILASASYDKTVKLWNVEDGTEIQTLTGHHDRVISISFSPDGKTVASASFDKTVKLWNLNNGKVLRTLEGHTASVLSVNFNATGRMVASASADGTIKLWDLLTEDIEPQTLKGHQGHVLDATFSPDGKTLASASADYTMRLWKIGGIEPRTVEAHQGRVWSVNFSPDGRLLASSSTHGSVQLWRVENEFSPEPLTRLKALTGHEGNVWNVSFSPDSKTIASVGEEGTIKLWNANTGELLSSLAGHHDRLARVSFSPDNKLLASTGDDGTVKLWDVEKRSLLPIHLGNAANLSKRRRFTSVRFSPNRKILASVNQLGTLNLWNVQNGQLLQTLKGHSGRVNSIQFSSDGQMLASAGADHTVKLWNVENGTVLKTLTGHRDRITAISFSPDDQMLASASLDSTVKLWDIKTGNELQTLMSHRHWVTSVSFSPDGKTLASAGSDSTVKLWNLKLDLDDFMQLGCRWLDSYLTDQVSEKDVRSICQSRT